MGAEIWQRWNVSIASLLPHLQTHGEPWALCDGWGAKWGQCWGQVGEALGPTALSQGRGVLKTQSLSAGGGRGQCWASKIQS